MSASPRQQDTSFACLLASLIISVVYLKIVAAVSVIRFPTAEITSQTDGNDTSNIGKCFSVPTVRDDQP